MILPTPPHVLLLLRMLALYHPLPCWLKALLYNRYRSTHSAANTKQSSYRNNPPSTGPGTSILSSCTIGILDSTTTRHLFVSGIRYPRQWVSVCGSGAGFPQRSIYNVIRWRRLMEAYSSVGRSSGYTEETLNLSMTAMQPPSYDEKVSWFRYAELVDDWVTFATIKAPKRGPLFNSRLDLISEQDSSRSKRMKPSLRGLLDFLLPNDKEALQEEQGGSSTDSKKKGSSIPTPKPASSRPLRIAGKSSPQPPASRPAENMFVEDMTSIPEQAHWNCVRKGKIHVLEIFAGSARFSQCCALTGTKVGTPVDIRNDIQGTTHGSSRSHPHGTSLWTIPTRPTEGLGKASATPSPKHRRYFIIENPQTSRIWYLHCTQPLEGNAGTFGSRTKLAQVYPYQFCQDLARIILRHLKVKPLDNEVYLLEDIFEPFTDKRVDILRKEMAAIDKEFNMTSSSTAVRIQDRSTRMFNH